jgi:hypothetical protein
MQTTVRFEMIDEAMVSVLRTKTPAERLAISNGMWRSARRMIEAILRKEHPDWSDEVVQLEIASRMSHGTVPVPDLVSAIKSAEANNLR